MTLPGYQSDNANGQAPQNGVMAKTVVRPPEQILVVDDDPDIIELLQTALCHAGYGVSTAGDGYEALRKLYAVRPALITLDIMMPGVDGLETLRQIRHFSNVPVIVVSAISELREVIRALDAGAADYVPKPFHLAELLSRVNAVLRRTEVPRLMNGAVFPRAGISVDIEGRRLALRGQEIRLSPKEFEVLWLLVKRAGNPVSYETICKEIWGEDSVRARDRAKWVIFLLRRKIEDDPTRPRLLINRPGYGYEFHAA